MKTKSKFFALFLGVSLLFAGLAGTGLSHKNTFREVKADGEPNASYVKVYDDNDSFNNTSISSDFNNVLLVYSGTAHGLSSDGIYDSAVLGKIFLNGKPLTQIGGSVFIPWQGQLWFRIAYPNTVKAGDIMEVESGLSFGATTLGNGFGIRLNNDLKWENYFGEPVNATYNGIYSDDYNNVEHVTGYNRLLIKYVGPTHSNPQLIGTASELKKYNGYVLIDGVPLSAYAGGATQIWPWTDQQWVLFLYPASAVSEGSIFEIREGCKIDNVVLEHMVFKLNSSSKWEKVSLIDDDSLVKNSDYKLFTISDYSFGSNSAFIFYSPSENIDAMSNSFGFRFLVNIPTGQATSSSATLKMAGTDIYGSSPIIKITLNYGSNSFLTFNNTIDWSTSINHTWAEEVDHLVEVYFIKTSETAGNVLLGIDGELLWKSASQSLEGLTFHNFFTTTGGDTASWYRSAPDTKAKALNRFALNKLHSNTVKFDNVSDTDACRGEGGYYAKAKAFYNSFLHSNHKKVFATSYLFESHRARLIDWGVANGETVSFNGSTGDLVIASNAGILTAIVDNKNITVLVVIASFLALSSLMAFLVLKKKKQN